LRDRAAPPAAAAAALAGGAGDDEDDNGKARDSYQRDGIYASDRVYRVQLSTCSARWADERLRPPPGSHVLAGGDAASVDLRKGFVARPGCVLVSADYAQVELRVLAHLANDESLLASFDGPDLFRAMAARLFRISDEVRVTAEMRNKVKAVTYAMLYGAGFARVVQALEVSFDDAKKWLERFQQSYPRIHKYLD